MFIRIFSITLPLLLVANVALGAIASGTVFESRTTATAGMVNGGGFNPNNASPGTDYSLQDAAQYNATDLASVDASVNPCVVTSASHNFVAADNGNYIHITAAGVGFTVGWYEIVSTAGNAATLDRACGTGAGSGATYYVGGALSWNSTLDDDFFDTPGFGNGNITIWFKNHASNQFTQGEAMTVPTTNDGLANAPNMFLGYNSTRGDNPTGNNRPVWANSGTNILTFSVAEHWIIKNIIITGTGTGVFIPGASSLVENVKAINLSTTALRNAFQNSSSGTMINIEGISIRGYAMNATVVGLITNSYFHDSQYGFINQSATTLVNNVFSANYSGAMTVTAVFNATRLLFLNNTFYGAENKRGVGSTSTSGSHEFIFRGNSFYGFTTANLHPDTISFIASGYNNYYNNTTNYSGVSAGTGDTTNNPGYTQNILLRSGSTATTSGSVLTQTGATFSTWGISAAVNTVPQHFVYIKSGTGVTTGIYGISSLTETTLTLNAAPGNSAAGDVVWEIVQVTGNGFAPSYLLGSRGFPTAKQDGYTRNWIDQGAIQRNPQLPRGRK